MTVDCVALLLGRKGSKGLPGKNIKLLGGKPLIAYTIEAAQKSGKVEKVFVSTDSQDIADIAEKYGAEVIWETEENGKYPYDLSTESYLRFAVDKAKESSHQVELIVFLQVTSPFIKPGEISSAIDKINEENYDSIVGVFKTFRYFGKVNENGEYVPLREVRKRRQEMEPWYCDNGALYVLKDSILGEYKNRYGGKIGIFEMSEEDSMEVDDERDWKRVERKIIEEN